MQCSFALKEVAKPVSFQPCKLSSESTKSASTTTRIRIGLCSGLKFVLDFFLRFAEFDHTAVDADTLALIEVTICISCANAFIVT